MKPVTNSDVQIVDGDFHVLQRTNETEESKNATYWKVYIPVGAAGVCNGKLMFTATDRNGA
jgi:hypothetical protein